MREEGSFRVTYRLNFIEVYELSARSLLWLVHKQKSGGLVCMFFGALAFSIYLAYYHIPAVFTLAVIFLLLPMRRSFNYIKTGIQEERTISAGGGVIQVNGRECTTFRSSEVSAVIEGWSILIVGRQWEKGQNIYYIISKKAFSSRAEREGFIACLNEEGSEDGHESPVDNREGVEKEIAFELDKNQSLSGMAEINQILAKHRTNFVYGFKSVVIRVALAYTLCVLLGVTSMSAQSWPLVVVITWLVLIYIRKTSLGSTDFYKQICEQGGVYQNLVGHWTIRMDGRGVEIFRPHSHTFVRWEFYQEITERESTLYLFSYRDGTYLIIPKSAFKDPEEMEAFVLYCREKGLRMVSFENEAEQCADRATEAKLGRVYARKYTGTWPIGKKLEFAAAIVLTIIVVAAPTGSGTVLPSDNAQRQSERHRTAPVSFGVQLAVLESLGIQIPERDQEDYRGWISEDEEFKDYLEHYPYVDILSYAGYGYYDEETGKRIFSDSVFWFDYEGVDASRDYLDIMEGLNALGKREFTLTNVSESGSGIDWESGSGELMLSFCCDGTPYRFTAQLDSDWIDGEIIDYFNDVLRKQGDLKRIYQMDDGGQGVILFYNTEEWAKEFYKKTGLKLELHQTEL